MSNTDLKQEPLKMLNLSEDEFLAILYAGKYALEQQRAQGTLEQFVNELMNVIPAKYKAFIRKKLIRHEGQKPKLSLLKPNLQHNDAISSEIPLYASRIAAGSAVLADDQIDCSLDLNRYLVKHPEKTFLVKVEGSSMIGAGIEEGDLLVVDGSIKPKNGNIVIAALNNECRV